VPYTISEVTVDGISVPFSQAGAQVQLGTNANQGFMLPPVGIEDRAYTFMSGLVLDGLPSSNFVIRPDCVATSSSGVATFGLKGGAVTAPRPFSLSMDVSFLPGASFQEAGFKLSSTSDIQITASPLSPSEMLVTVLLEGSPVGACELDFDQLGYRSRMDLEFHPQTGALQVRDASGVLRMALALPLLSSYTVSAFVTPFAIVDNITMFDSEEDGVTPQGIVFYNDLAGIAGFNVRAPSLSFMQDAAVIHDGARVDLMTAIDWFLLGQLTELVAVGYEPNLASTTGEAGWQFGIRCVYVTGHQTGIYIKTASGTSLFGAQLN
jgi:hypothetical protein